MFVAASTLDDLMLKLLKKLRAANTIVESSKGRNVEIGGVLLKLSNPRARLSRTENRSVLPSCLGEFLWYLSGRNDLEFIRHYVPTGYNESVEHDGTIWGAYGPRRLAWRGQNQIENVVKLMQQKLDTRQAVVQLFDALDIAKKYKDTPCTCTLQFLAREGRLNMIVFMRSNDAYLGLPHDVFAFTMIQELMAQRLKLRLGWYKHAAGSMHLYEKHWIRADQFITEGWQASQEVAMPPMPAGDQSAGLSSLIEVEKLLRTGPNGHETTLAAMHPYWRDLALVLQAYARARAGAKISAVQSGTSSLTAKDIYSTYIQAVARRAA